MEPTDAERANITNLSSLATWIPMESSAAESLFAYLGCTGDHPIRTVGFMDAAWFNHLLSSWKLEEVDPPPAVFSQAGILGRTARLLCGMEVSVHADAPP
eukprot:1908451-Amphidinium_carterae.1